MLHSKIKALLEHFQRSQDYRFGRNVWLGTDAVVALLNTIPLAQGEEVSVSSFNQMVSRKFMADDFGETNLLGVFRKRSSDYVCYFISNPDEPFKKVDQLFSKVKGTQNI